MRRLAAAIVLTGAVLIGGCAPFGFLVASFLPPPKIPAQYELPERATVLVFPDDPSHRLEYPPVRAMVAERVARALREQELVADVVPYNRLLSLQSRTTEFNRIPIHEVGRQLGADTVIYVEIDSFQTRENPSIPLWNGQFRARVRVVNVADGEVLWPRDGSTGAPVAVSTPVEENTNPGYQAQLAERLSQRMADVVAKLFYEHEPAPPASDGSSFD